MAGEDEVMAGEDEVVAVVTSHRHTTDKIQSYNISPNRVAGGFFLPQPPQHPACGSARGGSQNLSRHKAGIMNFHPLFLNRY